jgi:hypothetical protein
MAATRDKLLSGRLIGQRMLVQRRVRFSTGNRRNDSALWKTSNTKYLKRFIPLIVVLFGVSVLSGCGGPATTMVAPSAVDLYAGSPQPKMIPDGVERRSVESRVYPYTFEEVFDAVTTVVFQTGLNIEVQDEDKMKEKGG